MIVCLHNQQKPVKRVKPNSDTNTQEITFLYQISVGVNRAQNSFSVTKGGLAVWLTNGSDTFIISRTLQEPKTCSYELLWTTQSVYQFLPRGWEKRGIHRSLTEKGCAVGGSLG